MVATVANPSGTQKGAIRSLTADKLGNASPIGGLLSPDQFYGTKPTKILQFPSDVASGDPAIGNHGHYIMFYINEQDIHS